MTVELNRILVVDDNPEILNDLATLLTIHQYQVDTTTSGCDAIRRLRKVCYDLVICDIEIPDINGLDFLEKLRQHNWTQEVIIITGYLEQDYFIRAIRLGAADFISKPIDGQQLLNSIEAVKKKSLLKQNQMVPLEDFEEAQLSYVIDPTKFSQITINQIMNPFLSQYLDLSQDTLNELLICADEMLTNAYFHGILELTKEERTQEFTQLKKIISQKLTEPAIASRRIRFTISLNKEKNSIRITVEDDGKGFDYKNWLQQLAKPISINLDCYGRGLTMLYHLSDSLVFSKGGRKVEIIRKLPSRNAK